MQLLVYQFENKTTAAHCNLANKFRKPVLGVFVGLIWIVLGSSSVSAALICRQCHGINCLRTSYEATQKCFNDLDICVNVFDGQTLLAQGCWEQLPEELRSRCGDDFLDTHLESEAEECFKCNENMCNSMASSSFECLQCDSDSDENCRTNPLSLKPTRCGISRTPNQYCFVKQEGKRVIRGCSYTLAEQMSCLVSDSCTICQPSEIRSCNNIEIDGNDSESGGSNTEDGDSGNDLGITNGRICYQCDGINCLRTSYEATQKCLNDLDICATVSDGQTVLAQGCWEQLSDEVHRQCSSDTQCLKCNENLCNNVAPSLFDCIQCDSDSDVNCRTNPFSLVPSSCPISRTSNAYCFVKQKGNRVIRGCSNTLADQLSCLSSDSCMICQPSELTSCNNVEVITDEGGSSGGGGDGGGSGNGENNGGDSGSDGGTTENSGSGGGSEGNGSNGGTTENNGSGGGSEGNGSDGGTTGNNGSESGSEGNGSNGGTTENNGSGGGSEGNGSDGGTTGNNGSGGSSGGNGSDGGNTGNNGSSSGGNGSDGGSTGNNGSGSEANGSPTKTFSSYIFITLIFILLTTK